MGAHVGIGSLPIELIAVISHSTDEATQRLLTCVCHAWRETLLKGKVLPRKRACCNPSMLGVDYLDGSSKCLDRRACLVRYMQCLVQRRRWTVFDWLENVMEPSRDTDGVFSRASVAAASDGDLKRLQVLAAHGRGQPARWVIQKAILYGHQHVVDWFYAMAVEAERGNDPVATTGCIAPRGQVWAFLNNNNILCDRAAEGGHLAILVWLCEKGCPWSKWTCASAAVSGFLATLEWLRANGCPWDALTCAYAARRGHMDVVKWARAHGCPWNHSVCANAASNGHLALLQWARTNRCPWNVRDCILGAAKNGHLHVIRWMHAVGRSWTPKEEYGSHLNVVLGDQDAGWSKDTPHQRGLQAMSQAALGGHLHVVQWMRANGCPWDTLVCAMAARGGHMHVLEWAHGNGCPWDVQVYMDAAARGHLHIAEWACARGCPFDYGQSGDEPMIDMCWRAAEHGHLRMIQWLRAHGCPWSADTCSWAAAAGHLHVIQWARAHGCPWDENTYLQARHNGNRHIVSWLKANGCPRG